MDMTMTELPDLPRVLKKHEAHSALDFKQWVIKNLGYSASLEMKDTRGKMTMPYSEIKEEQVQYALAISSDKGAWIRVEGHNGEPDYIWLKNTPAFIVIHYPRGFCGISIQDYLKERDKKDNRKSILFERALAIATFFVR
jgi:hypothetical protein